MSALSIAVVAVRWFQPSATRAFTVSGQAGTSTGVNDAGRSAPPTPSGSIGGSIGLAVFTVLYTGTVTSSLAAGADQMTAFTDGYSAAFLGSGIAMVIAALLAIFLIRGAKDELMPQWDEEDAAAYTH